MTHKSDNFLQMCLDAIQEGISICDSEGNVIYVNKAACDIMGMKKEELLHKKADNLTNNKPLLLQVIENKKSIIDTEYFLKLKNNTVHLINSGYPVFAENGEVIAAIDIFRGIKRSRKLANIIAGYQASFEFEDIIGESTVMRETKYIAKNFASSDSNLLIHGESGTGKELFAQAIHNYSHRKTEPFIAINCANFPNELIDSELFGYEEGAFTGAKKGGKPGKFELANGGTLFLDEIGEMPLHLQAKLLRVLETKSFTRIGGEKPLNVDIRIISATNRKLDNMVKKGEFRLDLFYRLKVLSLNIPPLREREQDTVLLTQYFITKLSKEMQKDIKGMENGVSEYLLSHSWPGNVRELENTISRAVSLLDGEYLRREYFYTSDSKEKSKKMLTNKEKKVINKNVVLETLVFTKGNKKKAAEILEVSRQTIYRLLD